VLLAGVFAPGAKRQGLSVGVARTYVGFVGGEPGGSGIE
jgi:hypothetical protein